MFRTLSAAIHRTFRQLATQPVLICLVGILVMGAILLVTLVHVATYNVDRITSPWRESAHMLVYLRAGTTTQHGQQIAKAMEQLAGVQNVRYVPQNSAAEHVAELLGKHSDAFAAVGTEMLPASLEIVFERGVDEAASTHPIVEKLRLAPSVEEIAFVGQPDSEASAFQAITRLRWLILSIFSAIALLIATMTMRFYSHAKRKEHDVMKLLGAPEYFIRLPIALEGVVIGTLAASIAIVVAWGVYGLVHQTAGAWLSTSALLRFMPFDHILAIVALSGALGGVANLFATESVRYRLDGC